MRSAWQLGAGVRYSMSASCCPVSPLFAPWLPRMTPVTGCPAIRQTRSTSWSIAGVSTHIKPLATYRLRTPIGQIHMKAETYTAVEVLMLVVRLAAAMAHHASCISSPSRSMMQPVLVWLLRPLSKIHSVWTHVGASDSCPAFCFGIGRST